jgi:hypothetical protein
MDGESTFTAPLLDRSLHTVRPATFHSRFYGSINRRVIDSKNEMPSFDSYYFHYFLRLLVGKKELKLRKGAGFHLDILIFCFINLLMGFLGSCWISAATVRGVTHVVALTVYSKNNPPGEKPAVIGVKGNRIKIQSLSRILF